jgi:four helix bundle protein
MSASLDLRVRGEAMRLAVEVQVASARFPGHAPYGLTNQLRRAANSILRNVSEEKGRRSDREFGNFLYLSRGSLLEVQTQLMIAKELQFISGEEAQRILALADVLGKSLDSLIKSLRATAA